MHCSSSFSEPQCILSPCNLLPGLEQLAPKDIFKDNNTKKTSLRDAAYDFFTLIFAEKIGSPYIGSKADFVQLFALRKSFKLTKKETPPGWEKACENYLDSPMGSYSIAFMVTGNRFAILRKTRLNQYGRPENGGSSNNGSDRKTNTRFAPFGEPEFNPDAPVYDPGFEPEKPE